jgi:YVTN family beta-propeller protein
MNLAFLLATLLPTGVSLSNADVSPTAQAPYRIAQTIALGEGERWDYVTYDSVDHRVYVAHGDHVTVVDATKNAVIGQIATFPGGTHGVAIAHSGNIGYTDDGKAGDVAAFDLKTFDVKKKIHADEDADGMTFDAASGHVFVVNGDSKTITVIDPKTNASIATISVGAGLEAAAPDGKGKLFVDGVDAHDIIVIDTKTNSVTAHFPMQGCERPHGIAVDAQSRRVFATCVNKVMIVVDADKGTNIATVPIGSGSDGAVLDPVRKRIISSNGEGTISVIVEKDADHFVSLGEVSTAKSARTMAIDPVSGRLFLPAADIDRVEPSATPGGRPRTIYKKGSLKLLVLVPQD